MRIGIAVATRCPHRPAQTSRLKANPHSAGDASRAATEAVTLSGDKHAESEQKDAGRLFSFLQEGPVTAFRSGGAQA